MIAGPSTMVARVRRSSWYKGCLSTAAKYDAWKKSRKRYRARHLRRILITALLTDIEQWDIVTERLELFEHEDDIGVQLHALQMHLSSVQESDRDDAMLHQEMELLIELVNVWMECSVLENDDMITSPVPSTTGSHENQIGSHATGLRSDGIQAFVVVLCYWIVQTLIFQ